MATKTKLRPIFEQDQTLENSVLWSWIRDYYANGGIAVWSDGDIPFHITNTPVLAQEWARSVLTLCRDFARQGLLDENSPVEVFELGPGTGRHAFFLLKELRRLEAVTRAFTKNGLRFRVHLAELGRAGLDSLATHTHLQEFLNSGRLMLHQFDINSDHYPTPYHQEQKPETPSPNPVFLITNYILDSLPHDVLRIHRGEIRLGHTELRVRGLKKGADPGKFKDLGERIELKFRYPKKKVSYPEPGWNQVVESYKILQGETHVPFPTSALRLCDRTRDWSSVATVYLVADKSFSHLSQMVELEEPEIVAHGGGFSFNANVHAVGELAETFGGTAHHTSSRDGTLDLSHMIFPARDREHPDWEFLEMMSYLTELNRFHAVDRFRTKESMDELEVAYPLRLALDLVRLAGFDPQVFYELSDDILGGLDSDGEDLPELEDELLEVLPRCLDLVFPLPDDVDAAFEIGRVAYRMESYQLAEDAFRQSLHQYGDDPRCRFNLGLTRYYREDWEEALNQFNKALELNPKYDDAKSWIKRTRSKLKGSGV